MTRKYAQGTKVAVSKSVAEIDRLVVKHGGDQLMHGWTSDKIQVAFRMKGRMLKFVVPMPNDVSDAERRRLWRCLVLAIKAKFEIVATGIEEFDSAFMSNIIMPDGETFGDWAVPQIERMYDEGRVPDQLLLEGPRA